MDLSLMVASPWSFGLLIVVQLLGYGGLLLGRLSYKTRQPLLFQIVYFLSLLLVAAVAFLCLEVQSRWWLITGSTFAAMVVGVALDFRRACC